MYDANGIKYLYNSARDCSDVEGITMSYVNKMARGGLEVKKGKLKGYRLMYKEEVG